MRTSRHVHPLGVFPLALTLALGACGELDQDEIAISVAAVNVKPGMIYPNGAVVPPPGTPYRIHPKRAKPSVKSAAKRSPTGIYSPPRYVPSYYKPYTKKKCYSGYTYAYNTGPGGWVCVEKCYKGYAYRFKRTCVEKCRKGYSYAATSSTVNIWKCVSCPKGYKFAHCSFCMKCPKGYSYAFYQPHSAWRCVRCPKGYPNYYHKQDCVADCPKDYAYLFDKPPYKEGPLGSYTLTWQCLYAKVPKKKKKKK